MMNIIRKIVLTNLMAAMALASYGQAKPLLGQYFQNLPAFAPALTGANDFLDLRLSTRQQWTGFEGAPSTYYLSAYGAIKGKVTDQYRYRSLRLGVSGPEEKTLLTLKHGIGGYIQSDVQGPYKQFDINVNYAVHIPVFRTTFLALGVSTGLSSDKVDIADINVKNGMDDLTYQAYLMDGTSSTYFNVTAGLALHSDRYYVSYSMMPLFSTFIGGNETAHIENMDIRHQVMAGSRFFVSQDVELIPNGFVRIEKTMPVLFDAGLRVRYQQKYWAGLSYRNSDTIIGMLGIQFHDIWKLSYSYEYGTGSLSNYNNGTHEIVLGVQLFNYNRYTSMW